MKLYLAVFMSLFVFLSATAFELTSLDLKEKSEIKKINVFNGFGCTGDNVSPELKWTNVPVGTKSFAVTMYDPDAPTGSGWWHWTVFNIPIKTNMLQKGSGNDKAKLPKGSIQGRTDFGKPGYGGPCPPSGDKPHRYIFTVYALKTEKIELDENASGALLGFYILQNTIEKASITAFFGR